MDALVSKITVKRWLNSIGVYGYESKVDALPSIEAELVKRGHWIDTPNYYQRWKCSLCGCHTRDAAPNYCSNCGADMREEEEDASDKG